MHPASDFEDVDRPQVRNYLKREGQRTYKEEAKERDRGKWGPKGRPLSMVFTLSGLGLLALESQEAVRHGVLSAFTMCQACQRASQGGHVLALSLHTSGMEKQRYREAVVVSQRGRVRLDSGCILALGP